jgi:hypothetical protein
MCGGCPAGSGPAHTCCWAAPWLSHIAQSRLGSAVLTGAGPMLPTVGHCARLSICAKLRLHVSAAPARLRPLQTAASQLIPAAHQTMAQTTALRALLPVLSFPAQLSPDRSRPQILRSMLSQSVRAEDPQTSLREILRICPALILAGLSLASCDQVAGCWLAASWLYVCREIPVGSCRSWVEAD